VTLPAAVLALPASIPSPDQSVWMLGPVPIRGYAMLILLGMLVGLVVSDRRWQARGGRPGTVYDVALWAIPFGIVGARLYHVLTDWPTYFGADGLGFVAALKIWEGGLGIWGGVAAGFLGGAIACRRRGIPLAHFADAVAPGIVLGQAIGRWGNWVNQELFGRPSDLPWAVQIDPEFRPAGFEEFATFHPTFLYESLWSLGVFVVLVLADRRWRMGHGRVFALYVMLYTAGRLWIEALRIDQASTVLGLRVNIWTTIVVFLGALGYFLWSRKHRPGRLEYSEPGEPEPATAAEPGEPRGT
jgi:prolipoprotein diacylglyceryl transferase